MMTTARRTMMSTGMGRVPMSVLMSFTPGIYPKQSHTDENFWTFYLCYDGQLMINNTADHIFFTASKIYYQNSINSSPLLLMLSFATEP